MLREAGADVDGDDLLEHLKGRVASFKVPRHVKVVDELPMTPTGKIRKVELRQQALADFGAVPGTAPDGDCDPNHV